MDVLTSHERIQKFTYGEGEALITQTADGTICVSGRKQPYSSLAVCVDKLLGKHQGYRTSYTLRTGQGKAHISVYHKVTFLFEGKEYCYYDAGERKLVTDDGWTKVNACCRILNGSEIISVVAYFMQDKQKMLADIFIKELSTEPASKVETHYPERKKIHPPENIAIGAIRWDAYFSTDQQKRNISNQVARALSPNAYHTRAPFFARVTGENRLDFSTETQEQFDVEAQFAYEAGFDYFAYCWYLNEHPMSYARRQHLKSCWRNRLKMCAVIHVAAMDDETLAELAETMIQDYYFKIDRHPLVYVYDARHLSQAYLDSITEAAVKAGAEKEPYYVGMCAEVNPCIIEEMCDGRYDAVGAYSFPANAPGETYESLYKRNEERIRLQYKFSERIGVVPLITCGLDFRPRIDNPVSWMCGKNYAFTGTSEEIHRHASNVLRDMSNNLSDNDPKTVLVYAWNEHDEGGWCCPTLVCDEKGLPLYDANGNTLTDQSHLDALAHAFKEYKNKVS